MAHAATRPTGSDTLAPRELLDALRSCAEVLGQHAVAVDRLDAPDAWDEDLQVDLLVVAAAEAGTADDHPAEVVAAVVGPGDADDSASGPGSDMAATLGAGCDAVDDPTDFSAVCRSLSTGAAAAARTTAGRRLADFLAGLGDALRNSDRVDGARFALAMEAGAERVTESDDGAHPGCLLAVMTAAADGALAASDRGESLADVLIAAAEAGLEELEQGPLVDARLAERGTVDAAAAAFLLILDSLAAIVAGEPLPEPPREPERTASDRTATAAVGQRFGVACVVTPHESDIEAAADLEVVVHELSDALDFDGSGSRWSIRCVTTLPGSVVEALAGAGELSELHIGLAHPE